MAFLYIGGKFQGLDDSANPLAGGLLFTYAAGGTTPLATYTTQAGNVPNANPVVLDAGGKANVWLGSAAYRFVLKTSAGVTVEDTDNIAPGITSTALSASTGSSLVGFIQSGTGAVLLDQQGNDRDWASIRQFGAVGGGADDSSAFRNAAASGKRILVPAGTWRCNVLDLPDNSYFYGEGESSIISPYDVDARCLGCDSQSSSAFIDGVTLRDLKFLGTVEDDEFLETAHLVFLNGVRRLRVIDCYFVGFRGDGLYIGSGIGGGTERHNIDVIVRGCHFDGVNNDNRNGISVIDVDGMTIEECSFRNCAKADMPGSIDFEPDASFGVIKNVRVLNNYFYNTNGINGHVTFATQETVHIGNWLIRGNIFELAASSILLNLDEAAITENLGIQIDHNVSYTPDGNFVYKRSGDTKGVLITNNTVRALRGVWFSKVGATANDTELFIDDNIFYADGAGSFGVLCSENLTQSSISGNTFAGSEEYHIRIGNNGDAEYLTINDNQFYGTPASGDIDHDPASSSNAATHTCLGNQWGSTHNFEAARTDFCGTVQNTTGIDTTAIPSAFPYGTSVTRISSQSVDGSSRSGMLYTHKHTSVAATAWWQEFIGDYSAGDRDERWFRKAVDASNWDATWWQLTGA